MKLVLSGSGSRYPVFIGALRRLELAGIRPDEVCGVSGGAIIAAGLAAGLSSWQLEKLVKSALPGPLLDLRLWPAWLSNDPYKGVWRGDKILSKLRTVLPATFADCKIPLHVVTFNLDRGEHCIWNSAMAGVCNDIPRLVRASMSLPVFDSMLLDNEWHEDGGFAANFPLDVFGSGEDVIGLRFRSVGGTQKRVFKRKTERLLSMIDDFIEATTREHIHDAMFARVIQLDTTSSSFNLWIEEEDVDTMIAEGYVSTDRWLAERK